MLRPLVVAFAFLTRVPIPTGPVEPRDLGRAVAWFPVVGAALGAVLVAADHVLSPVVSRGLVALAIVVLDAVLTGGLHLDGVADVFDALGGGRGRRDRMLAILRDSRIGAHGAIALIAVIVAKLLAVAELVGGRAPWAVFAGPVAARWAVAPLVVCFPYARPDGLGKPFHGHAGFAQLAGATLLGAAAIGWLGAGAALAALAALATALALAWWLHRHLGGLTGDVYGAAIEAGALAFFLAAGLR